MTVCYTCLSHLHAAEQPCMNLCLGPEFRVGAGTEALLSADADITALYYHFAALISGLCQMLYSCDNLFLHRACPAQRAGTKTLLRANIQTDLCYSRVLHMTLVEPGNEPLRRACPVQSSVWELARRHYGV